MRSVDARRLLPATGIPRRRAPPSIRRRALPQQAERLFEADQALGLMLVAATASIIHSAVTVVRMLRECDWAYESDKEEDG